MSECPGKPNRRDEIVCTPCVRVRRLSAVEGGSVVVGTVVCLESGVAGRHSMG